MKRISVLVVSLLMLGLLTVQVVTPVRPANAADTWHIGMNNVFSLSYLLYAVGTSICDPYCSGNVAPRSLTSIGNTIDSAYYGHATAWREIIEVHLFAPTYVGDSTYWSYLDSVMNLYKTYNLNLVLTMGLPMPGHILTSGCSTTWSTVKDKLAGSFAAYLNHLKNNGYSTWMANKLVVEGFNEFDIIGCAGYATAANAADLQNGIAWYLNYYGITIANHSMPSYQGGSASWVQDYYTAGGIGYPHVHLYAGYSNVADLLAWVNWKLDGFNAVVPSQWVNKILLGEMGAPERINSCTSSEPQSMPSSEWNNLHAGAAGHTNINAKTAYLLFWRVDKLASSINTPPCEREYGIRSTDMSTWLTPATNLFNYLTTH